MAATPSEFYLTMLRRGIGAYEAGRFDMAVNPLKIAAFGLVDSIEHYQIAQVHLALTHDRLGNAELSREAARRVVTGERIEARFASLTLPGPTRTNFESLAQRVLTPADVAILNRPSASRPLSASTTPSANTSASGDTTAPPTVETRPATTPASGNTATPVPVETGPASTPDPVTVDDVRVDIVKRDPVTTEPAQPERAISQPVRNDAVPEPPKPEPAQTAVQTDREPVEPAPVPPPPAPPTKPLPQPTAMTLPPLNVAASFTAAEEALGDSRLADARAIYRELLEWPSLQRADLLRLAEGFYRSRDFANALRAFDRLGGLRPGEEPYRYYVAVALYETAQYGRAKAELAAVLPFIEETADVTRYRAKIEGAIN